MIVKFGPFQPSLERAFVERITGLKKNDPLCPLSVVTSSHRMSDRLQRLLALENGLSLINVSFHTFYSFAVNTAGNALSVPVLSDPVFFDRIMNRILHKQISRPFKGFACAVRSSIRDLMDAGVDPETAMEHLEEGLFGDPKGQGQSLRSRAVPPEAGRLRWLFEVFMSYKKKLKSLPVLCHADLVTLAAESAPASSFLKGFKEIIYYGFYDLTGLQLDFFKAVTENHPCSLFYPYIDHPAYSFAKKFFETNLHGAQNQVDELPCEHSNSALGPSLKGLFAPQVLPDRGVRIDNGRLSVASVSGRGDEIWKAAKEIIRLVEKEGYSYSEIGVVARTLEPYRTVVIEVFDENKIPFSLPAGQPVLCRPPVKIPFSLLKLDRNGFPSEAVADIISFPYFKRGNEADRWQAVISCLGITGGWAQWEGMLKSLGPKENLSFGLLEWLKKLKSRLQDLESQKSWKSLVKSALEIIDENFDFKNSPAGDLEAFGAFRESIISMEVFQLIGDSRKGEFLDALEEKIASAFLPAKQGNVSGHGVRVLDAMSARGESFRCLILVGLEEKFFPRLIREDPCLRDSARSALRDSQGYWIYPKMEGYEEEKLIFHMLVSSASHRLVCVFQRSDEDGKSVVVSLFLRELARSCGFSIDSPGEVEYVSRRNLDRLKATDAGLLSSKELSIRLSAQGVSPADYHKAIGRETGEYGFLRKCASFISSKGTAGEYDGQVGEIPDFLEYLKRAETFSQRAGNLKRLPVQVFYVVGRQAGRACRARRQGRAPGCRVREDLSRDIEGFVPENTEDRRQKTEFRKRDQYRKIGRRFLREGPEGIQPVQERNISGGLGSHTQAHA